MRGWFIKRERVSSQFHKEEKDPHHQPPRTLLVCCLGLMVVLDPRALTSQEQNTRSREFNQRLSPKEKINRLAEAGATSDELRTVFLRKAPKQYVALASQLGLDWPGMSSR